MNMLRKITLLLTKLCWRIDDEEDDDEDEDEDWDTTKVEHNDE